MIHVPPHIPATKSGLLVVGQCPGKREAEKKQPFVGPDGLQLRTWLRSAGLRDDEAAYTNVYQWYNGNPTYKPTAKEAKAGYKEVSDLIEWLRPSVVLLVGGVAAHMVFKGTMTAMNGRRENRDGVDYIGVFHPGYHRNAQIHGSRGAAMAAEADILTAIRQAAALLTGDEQAGVVLPEPNYVDRPFIPNLGPGLPVAVDVETTGDTKDPRVAEFVLAAVSGSGLDLITFDPPEIERGATVEIWNAPYDGVVLNQWDLDWDDGKLIAHMGGDVDTTLKGWALRNLDHLMMSYPEAERLGVLDTYCLDDAQTTHRAIPVAKACLDNSVLDLYESLERPLLPLWHKMSIEGSFYLHHDKLVAYQHELAEKVGGLLMEVEDMLPRGREVKACSVCGLRSNDKTPGQKCSEGQNHRWGIEYWADEPVNLNSPVHQLLPALQEMGIPVGSTSAGELELHADSHPVLRSLLGYREANKELSTYVDPWCRILQGDRLGAIWNPHGTWTMRVSSRGPNMQNIPNILWRFFHGGEGYTLLVADHAQLEVRTCAHLSEDPAMIAACKSEDVHGSFQKLLGLDDRRLTKVFVFRGLYADPDSDDPGSFMDAARTAGVPISFQDALAGVRVLHERFSHYYDWCRETRVKGVVPGLFGMRHVVPPGDEYHRQLEAVNAGPQGGGAIINKFGMLALHRAGYEVICQVHDSIVCRVRNEDVREAMHEIPRIMEEAIPHPLLVPLKVEIKEVATV